MTNKQPLLFDTPPVAKNKGDFEKLKNPLKEEFQTEVDSILEGNQQFFDFNQVITEELPFEEEKKLDFIEFEETLDIFGRPEKVKLCLKDSKFKTAKGKIVLEIGKDKYTFITYIEEVIDIKRTIGNDSINTKKLSIECRNKKIKKYLKKIEQFIYLNIVNSFKFKEILYGKK